MLILKLFSRGVDRLSDLLLRSMAVLVLPMALMLFYEVVSRYCFNAPTIWAQDMAIFFFAYIGILSGAGVMREDRHIRVDVLYSRLSPRVRASLDSVFLILALFFLASVAIVCWEEGLKAIEQGRSRSTEWAPPIGHVFIAVAAGAAMLWLQTFANWLRALVFAVGGVPAIEPTFGATK